MCERDIVLQYTLTCANNTPTDEDALWQMLFYAAQMPKDGVSDYRVAQTTPSVAPYVADWGLVGDVGIIARADQRVCGAVWLRAVPPDCTTGYYPAATHKLAIAVHPDYHGHGIGTTLMHGIGAIADQVRWCMCRALSPPSVCGCRDYHQSSRHTIESDGPPSSQLCTHR